jgi:hypothetical protein
VLLLLAKTAVVGAVEVDGLAADTVVQAVRVSARAPPSIEVSFISVSRFACAERSSGEPGLSGPGLDVVCP